MIKQIFSIIISLPIRLIKGLRDVVLYMFRSIHLSMRRKIAFDYLAIYVVSSLISLIAVPMVFLFFEIGQDAQVANHTFNQLFSAYNKGSYTDSELEFKVSQLSETDEVSYQVIVYTDYDNSESKLQIDTNMFKEVDYPDNIFQRIKATTSERLIAKRVGSIRFIDEQNQENTYIVRGYYPISRYRNEILTLTTIMLVFYSVGFVFMSMIGGARVKKVLNPIFYMTKTAEQISISNMDMRLDVETTKYELKDLAITLNEMIDRLDKDYGKQKRFVSDVSHELRTPISIISGYASMLERWGKKDEEILDESIEAIIGESKNMQHLVENLLTLVRSDNQTLKYEPNTFDIGKLICDVVKEFNMVNTKDQYITCDSSENIMVHLDESKIKQTLRIFADNAVKYTPMNGGIQVKCYVMNEEVFIHIKDTGIGISKQDLPFLFERFYRSDESRTKQTGGHGLGLSIARVMIIGHKGKIKVKSRIGKGSEFIITLPMKIEGDIDEISNT